MVHLRQWQLPGTWACWRRSWDQTCNAWTLYNSPPASSPSFSDQLSDSDPAAVNKALTTKVPIQSHQLVSMVTAVVTTEYQSGTSQTLSQYSLRGILSATSEKNYANNTNLIQLSKPTDNEIRSWVFYLRSLLFYSPFIASYGVGLAENIMRAQRLLRKDSQ